MKTLQSGFCVNWRSWRTLCCLSVVITNQWVTLQNRKNSRSWADSSPKCRTGQTSTSTNIFTQGKLSNLVKSCLQIDINLGCLTYILVKLYLQHHHIVFGKTCTYQTIKTVYFLFSYCFSGVPWHKEQNITVKTYWLDLTEPNIEQRLFSQC